MEPPKITKPKRKDDALLPINDSVRFGYTGGALEVRRRGQAPGGPAEAVISINARTVRSGFKIAAAGCAAKWGLDVLVSGANIVAS